MKVNERGNQVSNGFVSGDRYPFDFNFCKDWLQYDTDQDACYFGIWVSKDKLRIITFTEGDLTIIRCKNIQSFNAEIGSMNKFYDEGFEFKTINSTGITEYRQNRQQFYIN